MWHKLLDKIVEKNLVPIVEKKTFCTGPSNHSVYGWLVAYLEEKKKLKHFLYFPVKWDVGLRWEEKDTTGAQTVTTAEQR